MARQVWVWLAILSGVLTAGVRAEEAIPAAAPGAGADVSWCDSTDPNKLDLAVTEEGGRYFLTNVATYRPAGKNCYYFVNWDLLGTPREGKPIAHLEVEPGSLYLVHLYEIDRPRTLGDFWAKDAGKAASAAVVWVGGGTAVPKDEAGAPGVGKLAEVRESPAWFHYAKGDRLPIFARRFPEFRLPAGKVLSLAMFRTQDTAEVYRRHGVTHFPPGGEIVSKLPARERLLCINGLFNQGIGEQKSNVPHISPTENAFLHAPVAHAVSKAKIAADYDYIFLDEEFWHNDYQLATIERLCAFAREARRINPTLKLADFWNAPPYKFSFIGHDRWTAASVCAEALTHYGDLAAAQKSNNPPMVRQVLLDGKPTCLAQEFTAVSQCVYFDNLFGFIDQYGTFSNDFFIPAAIHTSRMNRRLPCNRGKPIIWFGMDILEGNYDHPRIAYPTRTTSPAGRVVFSDRLQVSPNFNEAVGLFGLLEADGAYLWDAHGVSDGDPNGIFQTMKYCQDYKDDRGKWLPDTPGTPIGTGKTWYPCNLAFAPDYYALGAWKYAQIADVVQGGQRVDFEYSTDGGKTWYVPPANGGAMAEVIRDKRPIVTGAVKGKDIAVVVFHPFQGVAERTALRVRYAGREFPLEVFGTRVRVYRSR